VTKRIFAEFRTVVSLGRRRL
jgi:hypothetical protein